MNPSLIPDLPIEIGYKCSWFAVRDMDVRALATIFSVGDISSCNWAFGLPAAHAGSIFISPAIHGWRVIIGNLLPLGDSMSSIDKVQVLVKKCSQAAGEAQFFATHRVVEFHCWMKAEAGTLVRAYAFVGDRMEILVDEGARTAIEPHDLINAKAIAMLESDDAEELAVTFPDEALVMTIAASWSLDPNDFSEQDGMPNLGIIGTAPSRFT
jgi:hypothetical protein